MEKFIPLGENFGLEGQKLLELSVTERLSVLGRGRVYTRLTEVKCSYKPSVSLL